MELELKVGMNWKLLLFDVVDWEQNTSIVPNLIRPEPLI
jgi:hypothetical protein